MPRATPARRLSFEFVEDALAYLSEHGFRRFSGRTWQSRRTGQTARWEGSSCGAVALTLI